MPEIIPITELKNTSQISKKCHATDEPIYVTKNGYGDMVIMSMKSYEEKMFLADAYKKLAAAQEQLEQGKVLGADESLQSLREKHNV